MSLITKIVTKQRKVPKGIYFGCWGNPMPKPCSCCDNDEKIYKNYMLYLDHEKNWEKLNYKKESYGYKNLFIFSINFE